MVKIFKILAVIFILIIIGLAVFIATFDVNKYKDEMIALVEEETGRDFNIEGDMELGISLIPTVKVDKVTLGNAKWGLTPEMLSVDNFEIQLGLLPLLAGDVKISHLNFDHANIVLETDKQGKGNWEFQPPAEDDTAEKEDAVPVAEEAGPPDVDIGEINIKNSRLIYKDGVKNKITKLVIKELVIDEDLFSDAVDILLVAVYNNIPISIKGEVGQFANYFSNKKFDVDIEATIEDAALALKGHIKQPKDLKGLDLDVNFNANTLDSFARMLDQELPDLGKIKLTGHISEDNDFYTFKSVSGQLLESDVTIDGQISAKTPAKGLDLNVKLDTSSLANFNKFKERIGRELPDIGPLHLKGQISEKEGFYYLDNININLNKDLLLLNGQVSSETPLQGFDLEMTLNAENLAKYNTLSGQDLPDAGPLKVKGHVSEKNGIYLFESVTAELPKSKLLVDGKLTNLEKTEGSDLNINFESTSLADLNVFTGNALPDLGPVALIAKVSDRKGEYHMENMKFNADKTDLTGNMVINMQGERPHVKAALTSNTIDVIPFQGEEKQEEKTKKDKVFSSDPLPLEGMKAFDTNLDIAAKKVMTRDHVLENVKLVMTLDNGKLKLIPLNANINGSTFAIKMDLDASNTKMARVNTRIDVKNFKASSLPDLKEKLTGGSTNATIDVSGHGNSVAEIMAGLNGKILMQMGPGTLKSSSTSKATADLFSSTFNAMRKPGSTTSNDTEIRCGVVNLSVKDGIATADKGIAFDTKRMNIIGSGIINLKTEELDIGIDPQPREGVGLSAGQLVELVRIGGTLAEPKAVPDTKAAFKTAARVGAAVATVGTSLLAEGLFNRATADTDPCATALGIAQPKTAEQTTETSEKDKNIGEKTMDSVKDAGSAIKDTFKGLFD